MSRSLEWIRFPRRAALSVAALGLTMLAGWTLDVALPDSVLPATEAGASGAGPMRLFAPTALLLTLLLSMALPTALFIAIRRKIQAHELIKAYDGTHQQALQLYSTSFDHEKILHSLLGLLAQRHAYPVSAYYAYDEWRCELVHKLSHGLPADTPDSCRLGEDMAKSAAHSGRMVYQDTAGSGRPAGTGNITPAALLAVPVIFRGQCHGVLTLASLIPLSEQERTFIEHIASQLGVTLNNLKQFDELKFLSEQLRQHGEEIGQKNLQLEEAYRTKSEFLANISHELRTPLNAIIGFSEALKDGLIGELACVQRKYIEDIYTSGEHLLTLINDILDLVKVESGKMTLELASASLNTVLRGGLNKIRDNALTHRLKVTLNADAGMPEIVADISQLKQIVYNLLSNAVKFTPDGGAITLCAQRLDDMLEIAVTDTGIGIRHEDQARLFLPFTQIDGALSRQYQGAGLGLVMVKRLAELHGGSVGLESELGKGSRFWARIPWRTALPGPDETDAAPGDATDKTTSPSARQARNASPIAHPSPAKEAAIARPPSGGGLNKEPETNEPLREFHVNAQEPDKLFGEPAALFIADEPSTARLLTRHLEMDGLHVTCMATGEQALEWLAQNHSSRITLDLPLPEIFGVDAQDAFNSDPAAARIPAVIVTTQLLAAADRHRLNRHVEAILEKAQFCHQSLIAEVRHTLLKQG